MKSYVTRIYYILSLSICAPGILQAQHCPDGALYNGGSPLPITEHSRKMVDMCTYGATALCTEKLKDWLALPLDGQVAFKHAKESMSLGPYIIISLNRLFTLFDSEEEDVRKGKVILEYQLMLLEENLWLAYWMLESNLSSNAVDQLNKAIAYELDLLSPDFRKLTENERILLSSFCRLLKRGDNPSPLSKHERSVWKSQIYHAGQLHLVYAYAQAAIAYNIETKFGLRNPKAFSKE